MERFFYIVKIIATTEILLIFLLVIFSYILKIIVKFKEKHNAKILVNVTKQLKNILHGESKLSAAVNNNFKAHLFEVLATLLQLQENKNQFISWDKTTKQLSNKIFKPAGSKLATSRDWFKRYTAALCFAYGFKQQDKKLLAKLVADPNLLISVNAAIAIAKFPTVDLIKIVINTFAKGRRLQQATNADILTLENQNISPMVLEILHKTKDPYVRAFCYRLLTKLPPSQHFSENIKQDSQSKIIELRIAALQYLATIKNDSVEPIILKSLNDKHWQVRAVTAKILGMREDEAAAPLLEKSLHDPQWWVRINAANALLMLGKKGIAILKKQSPKMDKFAFETAQEVLKISHVTVEHNHG